MPEPHETEPTPPRRARWFVYTEASSVGIEIAVAVTAGAVGGYYIERYLTHWSPWTMLLGFAFGVVVAVRAVLRTARAYQRSLRRDAAEAAAAAAPGDADRCPPSHEPPARRTAREPSE
jgi:F0F1-type ATP synthase assembly protein I